jgi:hypothetical protein
MHWVSMLRVRQNLQSMRRMIEPGVSTEVAWETLAVEGVNSGWEFCGYMTGAKRGLKLSAWLDGHIRETIFGCLSMKIHGKSAILIIWPLKAVLHIFPVRILPCAQAATQSPALTLPPFTCILFRKVSISSSNRKLRILNRCFQCQHHLPKF